MNIFQIAEYLMNYIIIIIIIDKYCFPFSL